MDRETNKLRGTKEFQPRDTSPEAMEEFFAAVEDPWGYKQNPDHVARARHIRDILDNRRFCRMLDIGCAEGFITHLIKDLADYTMGIDSSPTAIARAIESYGDKIDFEVANLLDFRAVEPFDLVIITGVLYYVKEHLDRARDTVDTVLLKGGKLLLSHLKESSGDGFLGLFEGADYNLIGSREFSCNNNIQLMYVFDKD
ncbi:MAG TPA: class I SAM-dependent methyltransferase [Acidobacteriota bacterium]|nr:class I SAM-dependent methyltransferase [Acidobacteriota bacterium]